MITQNQAWLELASIFDDDIGMRGICYEINQLLRNDQISQTVWKFMRNKIRNYMNNSPTDNGDIYLFPVRLDNNWDIKYSEYRADICRKFAEGKIPNYNYT